MRLADRSRAFRLSQPKALIGPVQATRYAGGLDLDRLLTTEPVEEGIPRHDDALADPDCGKVLPMEQDVGVGPGDPQNSGNIVCTQVKGKLVKGRIRDKLLSPLFKTITVSPQFQAAEKRMI